MTHQIAARVLASADQVAKRLLGRRRDPHQRQLAGTPKPQQPLGVATIGLDAIAGSARHRPRRADHHIDAKLRACARQPEPRRPRLID